METKSRVHNLPLENTRKHLESIIETLDDLKKAMIALRYINLLRGKHNVEDNYTKK